MYAEVLRGNLSRGVNGRKTMNADAITRLRQRLGDSLNSGIIDASHRRWKPSVYVDMATRTKMMRLMLEATATEAISRDVLYGVISSHGAKDRCGPWEGRIVKLTADAPGDYPLLDDLYGGGNGIFHPNCKHTVSAIRDPSKYI
jgi:ubiquitin-protein ligase